MTFQTFEIHFWTDFLSVEMLITMLVMYFVMDSCLHLIIKWVTAHKNSHFGLCSEVNSRDWYRIFQTGASGKWRALRGVLQFQSRHWKKSGTINIFEILNLEILKTAPLWSHFGSTFFFQWTVSASFLCCMARKTCVYVTWSKWPCTKKGTRQLEISCLLSPNT